MNKEPPANPTIIGLQRRKCNNAACIPSVSRKRKRRRCSSGAGINQFDPQTQLLRSVPGIGPRTAEVIAAYVDRPRRFQNGRQVSAYAGLVPRRYQSGETDRRGRIARRGPTLLRQLLVEAA